MHDVSLSALSPHPGSTNHLLLQSLLCDILSCPAHLVCCCRLSVTVWRPTPQRMTLAMQQAAGATTGGCLLLGCKPGLLQLILLLYSFVKPAWWCSSTSTQ